MSQNVLSIDRFNPLAKIPFQNRQDVEKAFHSLFEPLVNAFSSGGARVELDGGGAHFDRCAIDLEGFARPLWGIVPFVAGGGSFDHWPLYRKGLANGCNPNHPEYWGDNSNGDQRLVELAALGFALAKVPKHIWEPLDAVDKKHITTFLVSGRNCEFHDNNWKFFRILVDLGLNKVGVDYDKESHKSYLDDLDSYYIGDGWYIDGDPTGDNRRIDYYNPFAMHLYGIIYAIDQSTDKDSSQATKNRDRAREFAHQFKLWFADDGSNIPYGRSLTYRFACGAFWGGLALLEDQYGESTSSLSWGEIKGLYLRHWRWWSQQPISTLDNGRLTVGYAYPNQFMAESYNSACSPYWAFKMFLPLLLPENHPFWLSEEVPLNINNDTVITTPLSVPGIVIQTSHKHTVALISGPERKQIRLAPEKYGKFAYSTRYGFSVECDFRDFPKGVFDSMIAFSDDNSYFKVRDHISEAKIAGNILYSLWYPWSDVKVETWLIPYDLWHIRIHRIFSKRELNTKEGGFAIPREDRNMNPKVSDQNSAWTSAENDFSGIVNLKGSAPRTAYIQIPDGNTSVMFPRTVVPHLSGLVHANSQTIFITGVLASPNKPAAESAWKSLPTNIPTIEELELLFSTKGQLVGIFK